MSGATDLNRKLRFGAVATSRGLREVLGETPRWRRDVGPRAHDSPGQDPQGGELNGALKSFRPLGIPRGPFLRVAELKDSRLTRLRPAPPSQKNKNHGKPPEPEPKGRAVPRDSKHPIGSDKEGFKTRRQRRARPVLRVPSVRTKPVTNHSQRENEIADVEERIRNIWKKGRTWLGRDSARKGNARQSSLKRSSTVFVMSGEDSPNFPCRRVPA